MFSLNIQQVFFHLLFIFLWARQCIVFLTLIVWKTIDLKNSNYFCHLFFSAVQKCWSVDINAPLCVVKYALQKHTSKNVAVINWVSYSWYDDDFSYESIILDDGLILILPCGHFYTMSTLDTHLGLKTAYHWDENVWMFIATKKIIAAANVEMKKHFPDCRKVIHPINIYMLRLPTSLS